MRKTEMTPRKPFMPTTAQLETIAELETAKMPRTMIADRLGVDQGTFKAWAARLDANKDYKEPEADFEEFKRKMRSSRAAPDNDHP